MPFTTRTRCVITAALLALAASADAGTAATPARVQTEAPGALA